MIFRLSGRKIKNVSVLAVDKINRVRVVCRPIVPADRALIAYMRLDDLPCGIVVFSKKRGYAIFSVE